MGDAFDLLETMRWTPDHGFFLLDRHLRRIAESARHFGYACEPPALEAALDRAVTSAVGPLRVRLLLSRDGTSRVETAALEPLAPVARLGFALAPVDPADDFLYHKTTNRGTYEAAARHGFDDVILWNADRQVTESTIANIAAEIGGRTVTPPVRCGLLPGTFRAQLLNEGTIEEDLVTIDQLITATRLWLINSVREWRPAQLVDVIPPLRDDGGDGQHADQRQRNDRPRHEA